MFDPISIPRNLTWTAGQVAQALGISEEGFRKKRAELEQSFGFPGKLPGFNKWSQWAVIDWINSNGNTYRPQAPAIPGDDPEIEQLVSDLEADYAPRVEHLGQVA